MIHMLLTTGAMVFFIVAWNNGFFAGNGNNDFKVLYVNFCHKTRGVRCYDPPLGIIQFSSIGDTLKAIPPNAANIVAITSPYINMWRGLMLVTGLVVFALTLLFKKLISKH